MQSLECLKKEIEYIKEGSSKERLQNNNTNGKKKNRKAYVKPQQLGSRLEFFTCNLGMKTLPLELGMLENSHNAIQKRVLWREKTESLLLCRSLSLSCFFSISNIKYLFFVFFVSIRGLLAIVAQRSWERSGTSL